MNTQAHLLPAGQVGLQSGGQLRQGPDARWQNDWGGALASELAPGGATLPHYSSSHCLIYSLHVLTCKIEGRCHRGGGGLHSVRGAGPRVQRLQSRQPRHYHFHL